MDPTTPTPPVDPTLDPARGDEPPEEKPAPNCFFVRDATLDPTHFQLCVVGDFVVDAKEGVEIGVRMIQQALECDEPLATKTLRGLALAELQKGEGATTVNMIRDAAAPPPPPPPRVPGVKRFTRQGQPAAPKPKALAPATPMPPAERKGPPPRIGAKSRGMRRAKRR